MKQKAIIKQGLGFGYHLALIKLIERFIILNSGVWVPGEKSVRITHVCRPPSYCIIPRAHAWMDGRFRVLGSLAGFDSNFLSLL